MKIIFILISAIILNITFLDNVFAVDNFNSIVENTKNFTRQFKKYGGSDRGVTVMQEEFNKRFSKEYLDDLKSKILELKKDLNKVISGNAFNINQYTQIKSNISIFYNEKIKEFDEVIGNILIKLDAKDRAVVAKIFKINTVQK